jgi:hypothetical protein
MTETLPADRRGRRSRRTSVDNRRPPAPGWTAGRLWTVRAWPAGLSRSRPGRGTRPGRTRGPPARTPGRRTRRPSRRPAAATPAPRGPPGRPGPGRSGPGCASRSPGGGAGDTSNVHRLLAAHPHVGQHVALAEVLTPVGCRHGCLLLHPRRTFRPGLEPGMTGPGWAVQGGCRRPSRSHAAGALDRSGSPARQAGRTPGHPTQPAGRSLGPQARHPPPQPTLSAAERPRRRKRRP